MLSHWYQKMATVCVVQRRHYNMLLTKIKLAIDAVPLPLVRATPNLTFCYEVRL